MAKKKGGQQNAVAQAGQPNRSAVSFGAQRTEIRKAPIPTAAELQQYRDMDPDLYDLIKREFAANGEHRREMETQEAADRRTLVRAVTRNDTLGMVFSFTFAVFCVGLGAYFVLNGIPMGAILGVLGLLPPIIGAFRIRRAPKPTAET